MPEIPLPRTSILIIFRGRMPWDTLTGTEPSSLRLRVTLLKWNTEVSSVSPSSKQRQGRVVALTKLKARNDEAASKTSQTLNFNVLDSWLLACRHNPKQLCSFKRSFCLLNSLAEEIVHTTSVDSFKSKLVNSYVRPSASEELIIGIYLHEVTGSPHIRLEYE